MTFTRPRHPPWRMTELVESWDNRHISHLYLPMAQVVEEDRQNKVPGANEFFWGTRATWCAGKSLSEAFYEQVACGGPYVSRLSTFITKLRALEVASALEKS